MRQMQIYMEIDAAAAAVVTQPETGVLLFGVCVCAYKIHKCGCFCTPLHLLQPRCNLIKAEVHGTSRHSQYSMQAQASIGKDQ